MAERRDTDDGINRWPARRRLAWAALFVAILSWSSMLQPQPAPEVLNWAVTVRA